MCLGHRLAGGLVGAGIASLAFGPVHQWDFLAFALTLVGVGAWAGAGAGAHTSTPRQRAAARVRASR
ncbi:MAG TPA: hypothetical protein VFH78_00215 [Candidatus Thermoplasmatota archaeon]|nr:hypothetical protein [Candidatus Thermoplasmatota archaeon]